MKATFKSILAILFALCFVLTSCEHGSTGGDGGTTDPGAATGDTTNGTTTGDDVTDITDVTEETPKETAASEAIRTAFGRLSDATFFAANMKSETKYADTGSEHKEYETSYEISNDPETGECLIELKNNEFQTVINYTDGGSQCFTKEYYEQYEDSVYYDIIKVNTSFDLVKTVLYADISETEHMNNYALLFITPYAYNIIADEAAVSECELNVTEGVSTLKFALTGDELSDMFSIISNGYEVITYDENSGGTIEITISEDDYPQSVKLDCRGSRGNDDMTVSAEISYSRFNERSGITAPEWVEIVKKESPKSYIEEQDTYIVEYGYNPEIGDGLCADWIIFTSGEPSDHFEISDEFCGMKVTDVSLFSFENAVTKGGAVLLPKTSDVSWHFYYGCGEFSCDFFTYEERPEYLDIKTVHFKGEWEMSDGRPVPIK